MLDHQGRRAAESIIAWLEKYTWPDHIHQDLETAYVRLFVSSFGGIKAPLYHSCYEDDQGGLMEDRPSR